MSHAFRFLVTFTRMTTLGCGFHFPSFHETIRVFDDHPTQLITSWDPENPSKPVDKPKLPYIVFIPGNPGIINFYKPFLNFLIGQTQGKAHVVSMSYCGQDPTGLTDEQKKSHSEKPSDIDEQVKHKAAVISEIVPPGSDMIVVCHSLGCYIMLQLLNRREPLDKYNVIKIAFLCPVIGNMHASQTGQWFGPFIKKHPYFTRAVIYGFTAIPRFVLARLVGPRFARIFNPPEAYRDGMIDELVDFLKAGRKGIVSAINIGEEAIERLRNFDVDELVRNQKRMVIYYSPFDHWVPDGMYQDIFKKFPQLKIRAIPSAHTFMFHYAEEMAEKLDDSLQDVLKDPFHFQETSC